MKTLNDHVILYDAACPMCNLYTKAFIKTGMLDCDGREPYQHVHGDLKKLVDVTRAVNEIALVNRKTGTVDYGVQSLFRIIGHSAPFLKPLFACKPFARLASLAYRFVSYNRRVMVPSASDHELKEDQPAFRRSYRLLYLLFTWLLTAFILTHYSQTMVGIIPASPYYRELLVCGGQWVWQGLFVLWLTPQKRWDYLGNMMTISTGGGLLLLLGMGILKSLSVTNPYVYVTGFVLVAGLMLLEHWRRTRLLNVSGWLTVTWVLYRVLLLFVIL